MGKADKDSLIGLIAIGIFIAWQGRSPLGMDPAKTAVSLAKKLVTELEDQAYLPEKML